MKDNVLIIITAFNPDENLKNVVDKLIQKNFKNNCFAVACHNINISNLLIKLLVSRKRFKR